MIRLAARIAVGGGREGVIRLVLTAAGLALATAMLLCAAVAFPALQAHDARRGWMDTREVNAEPAQDESTTDPLLWRLTETRFSGRDVVRVDVAAEGPDAPVPPGLDALPGDGELAVSPALRDLLDRTDAAMLADRFPGEVTATVGRDALVAPDDLVVFVGHAPDELAAEPDVLRVRSIEAAPFSRNLTRIMRVAVAVGGVGLLAPVIVFVATATRLTAARRERRLAALRLAGATPRQVSVLAAVEATLAGVVGVAAGFAAFFAIRPALARLPVDGSRFFPDDLRLSWGWAAAVALGVPAIAAGTAVVSLRRARISPLGVARRAVRATPSPRPLLLVVVGLAGLVAVQATMVGASDVAVAAAIGAGLLVMIAGIVLSGPWITVQVARALARVGRRAPSLLAARRLQDNPAAGFRAIGGLVLAVFVGTVFSAFTASVLAGTPGVDGDGLRPGVVAAALNPVPPPDRADGRPDDGQGTAPAAALEWPATDAADQAQLVRDLAAIPGVERVATAHAIPADIEATLLRPQPTGPPQAAAQGLPGPALAMACTDVVAIGLGPCEGTTIVTISGSGIRTTGLDLTGDLPVARLGELPAIGFAAATDGTEAAVERARTILEQGVPGSPAVTQADLDAEDQSTARTTQRISNLALAVTLVIAGCSLAVAVAGSIVERRQPFALLRLAGTRVSDLRRVVLAEAAAPLLVVAVATAGLGLTVTAVTLASDADNPDFALPGPDYWTALVGGLVVALGVVASTLPLLDRLTAPGTTRFE